MLYCKAKFGRGFLGRGCGFGSRLFPWARCRIFAKIHGAKVVSPIWVRPAIGQIFRGGVSYKNYLRQLVLWRLMKKRPADLGLIRGGWKLWGLPAVLEPRNLANLPEAYDRQWDAKIIFRNYDILDQNNSIDENFELLNGWSEFLHQELRAITRTKYLKLADNPPCVPIGLVVRCGHDFTEPEQNCARLRFGDKTPLRWFVEMVKLIRSHVGKSVAVYVVSDGTEKQLAELLTLENIHLRRPGSAISDLLTIARARVLLASGSSGFAAWACFLGQMVSASHPGQPLSDWKITSGRGQFIGEVDPKTPPSVFITAVKEALAMRAKDEN